MSNPIRSSAASAVFTMITCFLIALGAALVPLAADEAQAGQAALSWKAPTTNSDGTPLNDLAGYKIHFGNSACSYQETIDVGNVTSYQMNNLTDGASYYFAVTAYSSSGAESALSGEKGKLLPPYLIIATYGPNGTLTVLNNPNVKVTTNGSATRDEVTVNDGAAQSFAISANPGYLADVRVDGSSVGPVTGYTFTAVHAGHALDVAFPKSYTMTSSAAPGGSIAPAGTLTVAQGSSQAYTITPAAGYSIADVKVDGASIGPVGSYGFTQIAANHTIQASFAAASYTITASAGSGGSIAPAGTVALAAGGSQTYTVTAAAGYSISDVKVDGVSVGRVATYSFTNLAANHTIQASFVANYTITASAGSGGSIVPSGTVTLVAGGSQTYTVTATAGYSISDVKVDGVSVGRVATYSFSNVAANHTIQASFAPTAPSFAVNSGGPRYTSPAGLTYLADTRYSGGSTGTSSAAIKGTVEGALYQSERYGNFSYSIPLANGKYDVTLKFAETYFSASNKRVFSVAIGGTTVISNLDIYAKVGKNTAYDVVVPATVGNGSLKISFSSKINNAKVCGIKIAAAAPAPGPATASVGDTGDDPNLPAASSTGSGDDFSDSAALDRQTKGRPHATEAPEAPATSPIPADRSIVWTDSVGVIGDIPARSSICASLSPSGGDDSSALQGAINGCPMDGVVTLAAGTYQIGAPIAVKSGVTLRGAGMGATVIKGKPGMPSPYLLGFDASPYEDVSLAAASDFTKGSNSVTTKTPHGWSAGDIILIDQLNTPSGSPVVTNLGAGTPQTGPSVCTWCGRASGTRSLGQLNRVSSVPDPNTALLETPLVWNFNASLQPQLTRINSTTTNAGIEDLTVDNSASGSISQANDGATVAFYGAANCWLLRVEAIGAQTTMVRVKRGYRNTIRGCTLHEGVPALPINHPSYGISRAYGIWIGPGSGNLVEGNKLYHLAMPIKLDGPASGNVISYNYVTELYYTNTNWNLGVVNMHGGHPAMNLLEGNYSDGRLIADDIWGSSSHNTFFRNRHTLTPGKTGAPWDLDLQKNAQYYNIIGNVLGATGTESVFQFNNVDLTSQMAIFRFGYTADGDGTAADNDPQVAATVLVNGNWDSVNKSVVWNGAQSILPSSLYLTGKPGWWGSRPWPAVGPDVSPMYPAAPGVCNGMPWDDGAGGSSRPSPPAELDVL